MVYCPHGADQPANLERVRAAVIGIVFKGIYKGPIPDIINTMLTDLPGLHSRIKHANSILTSNVGADKAA